MNNKITILKRFFVLSLPLLAVVLANLAVNAKIQNFCLFRWIFNHECFGCGLTRAFIALSRFEFSKAYELNHLVVVVVPLLIIIWLFLLKLTFTDDNYKE